MHETHHRLHSSHLANERDIWIQHPARGTPRALLVFLDGEFYRDRIQAHEIAADLQERGEIVPALVAFVSHATLDARWVECPCHPPFAAFLLQEFVPWLERLHPETATVPERVLTGLSYTGLAASFVALHPESPFTTIVSQSGSYWWNDGWLTRQFEELHERRSVRFLLNVGARETQTHVRHRDDVIQTTPQIDGVRAFRDALHRRGYAVDYREFDGGHEFTWWKQTLPDMLRQALNPARPEP